MNLHDQGCELIIHSPFGSGVKRSVSSCFCVGPRVPQTLAMDQGLCTPERMVQIIHRAQCYPQAYIPDPKTKLKQAPNSPESFQNQGHLKWTQNNRITHIGTPKKGPPHFGGSHGVPFLGCNAGRSFGLFDC